MTVFITIILISSKKLTKPYTKGNKWGYIFIKNFNIKVNIVNTSPTTKKTNVFKKIGSQNSYSTILLTSQKPSFLLPPPEKESETPKEKYPRRITKVPKKVKDKTRNIKHQKLDKPKQQLMSNIEKMTARHPYILIKNSSES